MVRVLVDVNAVRFGYCLKSVREIWDIPKRYRRNPGRRTLNIADDDQTACDANPHTKARTVRRLYLWNGRHDVERQVHRALGVILLRCRKAEQNL
ncbi:hypothetical protein D3C78_1760190 [compost metagenome]